MQFVIDNWLLFLALAIILALLLGEPLKRKMLNIDMISVADVPRLTGHDNAVLVDVREDKEYKAGHIPDALSVPLSGLSKNISKLEKYKNKPLILSCRTHNRSLRAATILSRQGFEDLKVLHGGFMAWQKENLPIEK
ncbi:MAG: rhodanese-like domain-containing protein [Gammaproteobacteria bacterium]|nr:MAG: rhodanese-like domain-containing protein [Gammaproteobacteria bacterium]RTZ62198.1 MAG: rhodanese-like domain-containing protein [Gammaproteobacteria bacterium]